jgi:ribosome-binding factor A
MPFGEILTLTSDGLMIEPHLVQSIGIYDKSRCWGKIVNNIVIKNSELESHFIISTVPYVYWPAIIRIDIRVLNDVKSYLKALEIIKNNDVNIISLRTTHGGITHNDIQVIGEVSHLLNDKKALEDDTRSKFRPNLSMLIFGKIYDIEDELEKENIETQFLYDTKNSDGGVLYNEDRINKIKWGFEQPKKNRVFGYIKEQLIKNIHISWVRTLAIYSILDPQEPFELIYDSQMKKLVVDDKGKNLTRFKEEVFKGKTLPNIVIGTFNPNKYYLRLKPVFNEFEEKKLFKITISYVCEKSIHTKNSICIGLTYEITKILKSFNINPIKTKSKIVSGKLEEEEGGINMACINEDRKIWEPLRLEKEIEARLNKNLKDIKNDKCTITSVKVRSFELFKIFFSMHNSYYDKYKEEIKKLGKKHGFLPIIVRSNTDQITNKIREEIDQIDALIQILNLNEQEQHMFLGGNENFVPDIGWLNLEWGAALIKKIPTVRVADITQFSEAQWIEHAKGEQLQPKYYKEGNFINVLEGAIKDIIDKLYDGNKN